MSSVHRPAGFLLSALFALGLASCGDNNAAPGADDGEDDDGGGATLPDASGGDPDSGGGQPDGGGGDKDAGDQADAGDLDGGGDRDAGDVPDAGDIDGGSGPDAGEPDAGEPDAGSPDAGPDPFDGEFLLGIVSPFNQDDPIRFIATVDFTGAGEGGTADFSFQPIIAADCVANMGGLPVGDPIASTDVPVAADGTFQMTLNGTLPAEANPVPALECQELAAPIEVTGQIVSADLSCGTVVVLESINGTFGAIRIPPGTVGDENLPAPAVACP